MTATLEARSAGASGPGPDARSEPTAPRTVPPALAPWRDPHPRFAWVSLAVIAVVALLTRLWDLGFPATREFDEAYYAVEAQEMLRFGYEDNRGYSFIVHPPLGKWLIAGGEWLWDRDSSQWLTNSVGWRIAPAIFGVATVVIVARVVRRMTRSSLAGAVAGGLMCMEGMSLVLARVALLDVFLQTFVIAGFAALVVDRDAVRARLAGMIAGGIDVTGGVPSLGPRPWRLVGGVMLALACAVKWTGLSFFVLFVIMSLVWDRAALKSAGVRRPTRGAARRSAVPALGSFVVAPILAYLMTYLGWFVGENSWDRHWADTHSASTHLSLLGVRIPFSWAWIPGPVRSLGSWTHDAYHFHEQLDSPHIYQSNPWAWLVAGRPVVFYYDGSGTGCGASSCSREVILLATPILWWAFVPALLWLVWRWVTTRDWRAAAIIVAFVAGWLVWFQDLSRTMFFFYMAPLVPFLVMGVTMALGAVLGRAETPADVPRAIPADAHADPAIRADSRTRVALGASRGRVALGTAFLAALVLSAAVVPDPTARDVAVVLFAVAIAIPLVIEIVENGQRVAVGARRRLWGSLAAAGFLGAVIADFAWMWPLFTGELLTFAHWHAHMWLPSWV